MVKLEKYKKSIAKFMAVLMMLMIFASSPQTIVSAAQMVANWSGVNLGDGDVANDLYLQRVIQTANNLRVGQAGSAASWDKGMSDYYVTSTDLIDWHVQSRFFYITAELNGRFFGVRFCFNYGANYILSTDLQNSWQEAALPDIDGEVFQIIVYNGILRLTYSWWGNYGRVWGYMTSTNGETWQPGGTWTPTGDAWRPGWVVRENWQLHNDFVGNDAPGITVESVSARCQWSGPFLSYITTVPGAQPRLVRIFHNNRLVSQVELDDGVAIHPDYRFPDLVDAVDVGEWIEWVIIPDPAHASPAPVYPENFYALFLNGYRLREGREYDFFIEEGSTRVVARSQTVSENANTGTNVISAEFRVGDQEGRVYRASQSFTNTVTRSDWAVPYLLRAQELGLLPTSLQGPNVDLRNPITRAEFAGVVVMAFENLSERQALPAASGRFTDTQDNYVLRAYNAGLMIGLSPTAFGPGEILNREQTATALTRVFKSSTIPGWTIENDDEGLLDFTWPALFADDANISDWARESVYFMAANDIIRGTGNNMFSPRAATAAQEAIGYAAATREQAVVIALRMIENLG